MENKIPNPITNKYEIAGLKVLLKTYYKGTRERAENYLAKTQWTEEEADFEIGFDHEVYEKIYDRATYRTNYASIEYVHTGSLFNRKILFHEGCMLHSSAVVVDGYAYLFSADSGTGKSTHTNLWLEKFGDKAFIINDDKPVIRKVDGQWKVFGTPWSGKHDISVNTGVELGGIVFLERSEENWIKETDVKTAIPLFFKQTIRKINRENTMDIILDTMSKVLSENPIYKMGCNISQEAVDVAYEKIRRV